MKDKIKITFEPGCFDKFEGTQEELDSLVAEIVSMFEGKTVEEIQAMDQSQDSEELDELFYQPPTNKTLQ